MSRKFKLLAVLVTALIGAAVASVPAYSAERERRPAINIQSNDQFDAEHGVRSGAGTMENPFVISGWQLNSLRIENTDRHVLIEDNTVTGQMVLNWMGDRAHVHHNEIGDLRVNQNVARTGMPTSGEIAHNTFRIVGQLRHWDGVFERNVVGTKDRLEFRGVNFDGFNGARFRNNTIYGYMDARLHGHHHSSGYGGDSHQHSGAHHAEAVDHTQRYHQVSITGNKIETTGSYALAYLDTNHAANDRRAASEREEALKEPHVHHTRVDIAGNRLTGAGLLVNVFNAADRQKHPETATGLVQLRGNRISLGVDDFWSFRDLHGIEVRQAQDLDLIIDGNHVVGQKSDDAFAFLDRGDRNAGVFLRTLDKANVWITHNSVFERAFGVRAEQFTENVRWVIRDLKTQNVEDPVYADESVKDSPAS